MSPGPAAGRPGFCAGAELSGSTLQACVAAAGLLDGALADGALADGAGAGPGVDPPVQPVRLPVSSTKNVPHAPSDLAAMTFPPERRHSWQTAA